MNIISGWSNSGQIHDFIKKIGSLPFVTMSLTIQYIMWLSPPIHHKLWLFSTCKKMQVIMTIHWYICHLYHRQCLKLIKLPS